MKIVVDIPADMVADLRELVEHAGYRDIHEFVLTALRNQLALEETPGGMVHDNRVYDAALRGPAGQESTEVAFTLALDRQDYREIACVEPPKTDRVPRETLSGHYNRLFPVKIVLRALANDLAEGGDVSRAGQGGGWPGVEAEPFGEWVADVARQLGKQLESVDDRKGRKRGARLSTGLPTGDDPRKSKDRFISHFVGYCDRNGLLQGAPARLKFVDIRSDQPDHLMGLTEAGLKFATLDNPVLDGALSSAAPLSKDERNFYLRHTARALPEEHAVMAGLADAIRRGIDRPDPLTAWLVEKGAASSESRANTIRSGLLGRMCELDLILRRRVGQRGIAYELTEAGERLANKMEEVGT